MKEKDPLQTRPGPPLSSAPSRAGRGRGGRAVRSGRSVGVAWRWRMAVAVGEARRSSRGNAIRGRRRGRAWTALTGLGSRLEGGREAPEEMRCSTTSERQRMPASPRPDCQLSKTTGDFRAFRLWSVALVGAGPSPSSSIPLTPSAFTRPFRTTLPSLYSSASLLRLSLSPTSKSKGEKFEAFCAFPAAVMYKACGVLRFLPAPFRLARPRLKGERKERSLSPLLLWALGRPRLDLGEKEKAPSAYTTSKATLPPALSSSHTSCLY